MPQRFLRPGITTSERWNSVSFEAQSLYIRILTLVDDFGRYDARIPILHGQCFALRNDIKPQRTAALRSELHAASLVVVYEVCGKEYLEVTQWQERARCERSKYPDPLPIPQDSAAERSGTQPSAASLAIASTPSPSIIASTSSTLATTAAALPPELDFSDFRDSWDRWGEYRKQARLKAYTDIGAQAQLSKLAKIGKDRAITAIENSIANAYQGIFEPKHHSGKTPAGQSTIPGEHERIAASVPIVGVNC